MDASQQKSFVDHLSYDTDSVYDGIQPNNVTN